MLGGFLGVVYRTQMVPVCHMGMVPRLLVVARFVVLRGGPVVMRGMLVMLRCLAVMFSAFV